jgi:4-hydroxy-2-oxoheptanedioate aldolase
MRRIGRARGLLFGGTNYFDHAKDQIVVFAMLETTDGGNTLEEILTMPGLDGVYIGPNDLAVILGARPESDLTDQHCVEAIAHIVTRAKAHRRFAGIFCARVEVGAIQRQQGFDVVTLTHEGSYVSQAARANIAAALAGPNPSRVEQPAAGY